MPRWLPKWGEVLQVIEHNSHKKKAQQKKFQVSYLQSTDSRTLETQICLEILGDFPDETLEGQLPDEQLGGLLVPTDLTQSNSTGPATTKSFFLRPPNYKACLYVSCHDNDITVSM